jgi:hypothetical protein
MDAYSQALASEANRQVGYSQIKAQYDLANEQRQISAGANALINAGLLTGTVGKTFSAIGAMKSALTLPGAIKSSVFSMARGGQLQSGMADRVDELTTLLRTNPKVNIAFNNFKTLSSQGSQNALGNFTMEVNRITGKSLDFASPHEIALADRVRNTLRDYDSFNRNNRGLSGTDADAEVEQAQARIGDMIQARGNLVNRLGIDGAAKYDAENTLVNRATGALTRAGRAVQSGARQVGEEISGMAGRGARAIESGVQETGRAIGEIAGETRQGISDFVGSVRNFGDRVVNNIRGYGEVAEGVEGGSQRLGGFFTSREYMMSSLLGSRRVEGEMNPFRMGEEEQSLLPRPTGEPEAGMGSYNPEEAMAAATNARAELVASQPDINAGVAPSGTSSTAGNVANATPTAGESAPAPAEEEAPFPEVLDRPPRATVSGESAPSTAPQATATAEASGAEQTTGAIAGAGAEAETAAAAAGEAGAGLLGGGLGEAFSLLGSPIGFLGALAGIGYSIYQAVEPQSAPPSETQVVQPSFNPITSAMPASTAHF